ncbi:MULTISPECIES: hypothetical protein [Pyrobaculum]|uniref:Thioredoxin-like fold domain-containing protein n=1 Tax=Pyrobaculum arsenaticum TaxID=121277 RepID=A0A7L4P721_9CREN|nr:hypothetical protein [Pyrobaculum arsenaticum]MCY0890544.1 hypothetical protein [Pyrobaculum arsenaticum]NYR14514.1 hypothetical protein [Pyrobaculum arsenaticum]
MNPKVVAGIVLAIIAAVGVAVYLLQSQPPANKTSTQPVQTTSGKLYVYTARLEGGQALELLTYYIPLSSGTVYAQIYNNSASYFMVKNTGIINVLSQTLNSYQKATYYSKLLQICVNSTTTTTVAGERITLSNSQCQQSTSPLPTAKTFDELVLLIQGLPGPTSPSQWKQSGTAQTPYGQATVYTNTTEVPIMQGLSAILDYEKQQLADGTIYQFKVKLSYGGQVAAILTYTLRNITTIPADVANVLNELSRDVVGTNGGGLDILRVAEKIGMKYDGKWPAAIVFFDLQCPYCAQLFKYNYTLFEGHRLVLVDLIVHPDALPAHERLRCLYNSTPQEVIPTLRVVYDRFLAGDQNYTSILPQSSCPIDANAGMQLATLIAGQNVGTPLVVVVYPNGTYTYVVGYDPASIAKALKG